MSQELSAGEQKEFEHILNSGVHIPPQPTILQEIQKLIDKPGNSLVAIGNLIKKDVGLSSAIFKVVNSPVYKPRSPIDSVTKAITIIGMVQITNIIKGVSLLHSLSGQEPVYDKFWERSHEIASLSSVIAGKQLTACNVAMDQAYMAGLFHECGVPILMQRFPAYCKMFRLNKGSWPDFREEDKRLETDHAVVGYLVAKHWHLPDFVCKAVRYHHDALYVGHAALTLVSILQAARHCYALLHHLDDNEWPNQQQRVCDEIGLAEADVDDFLEDVIDTFNAK